MAEPQRTSETRPGPLTKKLPCWVCGGDLLFNFATVNTATMTIHTYCPRCKRPRVLSMRLD